MMKIDIVSISREEFQRMESKILFQSPVNNRFAKITCNQQAYTIGWRSELVDPYVYDITNTIAAVGVDENFSIVDLSQAIVLRAIYTDDNFFEVRIIDNFLYAIYEISIFKIDLSDWAVLAEYVLPDIFEEMYLSDKGVMVICMYNVQYLLEDLIRIK